MPDASLLTVPNRPCLWRKDMLLLPAVLLLAACGTTAPLDVPAPPPPPAPDPVEAPSEPTPALVEVPLEPVVAEPEPPPPLAPRGSIEAEAVYPQVGLSQWTLANGALVVYKHLPEADVVGVLGIARGGWLGLDPELAARARGAFPVEVAASWPGEASAADDPLVVRALLGPTERRIEGRGSTLDAVVQAVAHTFEGAAAGRPVWSSTDALLGGGPPSAPGSAAASAELRRSVFADPSDLALFIVGPDDPDGVESAVGRLLSPVASRKGLTFEATPPVALASRDATAADAPSVDLALGISVSTGERAALDVLATALRHGADASGDRLEVEGGTVAGVHVGWLRVRAAGQPADAEALVRRLLASEGLDVTAAVREWRSDRNADPAAAWLDAIAALYDRGVSQRPVTTPLRLDASAPVVLEGVVRELARRFAATSTRALLPLTD